MYTKTCIPIILTIVAVMVMALSGAVYFRTTNNTTPATNPEIETNAESSSGLVSILDDAENASDAIEHGLGGQSVTSEEYADGTYTKTGSYRSPGGNETITVTLTLSNDIITDAKLVAQSDNKTSQRYMDKFAGGYSALVVGKNIDAVNLTVVNGSSLTPKGFMDAVAAIKGDATL